MEKIIFLSHCILNQYARAKGVRNVIPGRARVEPVYDLIKYYDVGIVQMPCPEIEYEGLIRRACGQDRYDNFTFSNICNKYALYIRSQIEQYSKAGYCIVGLVGVNGSPTCGVTKTSLGHGRSTARPGLFISRIKELLEEENIMLNYCGVSLWSDEEIIETKKQIEAMLSKNN